MCHISLARFTRGRASKPKAFGFTRVASTDKEKERKYFFLIYLSKMAKNVHYFLDDQDTDQCASEKNPKPQVALEFEKLSHFTFMKGISHRKHFVFIGSVYFGTTPEVYFPSLHIYLSTKFSIIKCWKTFKWFVNLGIHHIISPNIDVILRLLN